MFCLLAGVMIIRRRRRGGDTTMARRSAGEGASFIFTRKALLLEAR